MGLTGHLPSSMMTKEKKASIFFLYKLVTSFICMKNSVYLEKDSSEIYEDLLNEEDNYQEDEERASDRMEEMVSKYGNY